MPAFAHYHNLKRKVRMPPMQRKSWPHTLFPKLVFAFLLVIIPLYLLGITMNRLLESSVQKELSNSLQSRVSYYTNSLETERTHMTTLLRDFVIDQDLHHFTFVSNFMTLFEWSETVTRIQNKLLMIRNSSIYIKEVKAHFLTLGRTLSSNKSITETLDPDYEAVKPAYGSNDPGFISWQDRLFLGLSYPESELPDRKPSFVLSLELDTGTLRKSLLQMIDYERSGAFMISPQAGWSIANAGDAEAVAAVSGFARQQFAAGQMSGLSPLAIGGSDYLVAYEYSALLGSYVVVYIPHRQVFGQIESYRQLYWLLSLIALLIIVAYSYWLFRLIHKPLQKLIRSFRKVEGGSLEPAALPRSDDEFRYLFQSFNRMVDQLKVLFQEVYEQKLRAQSSELKQLQSQINPHFLYNTYFILNRLAKMKDQENVLRFSRYLGEYFQYITRTAASDVPFEDEYKHSTTYAAIQTIRFSERIQAHFAELPEGSGKLTVPKLILQPVIENAYKHGLEQRLQGGLIAVAADGQAGALIVTVEDNGERLTDEGLAALRLSLQSLGPDSEYTGLLNVHRRLQIHYGAGSGISVERGEQGGLKVVLTIVYN